jgi:tRNA dimethylallyltransferase
VFPAYYSSGLEPSGLEPGKTSTLVIIGGPTGSGKSAFALFLAAAFQAEIVNYDSVQVYRGLDIGSAKTPPEERQGIPHHLLDVLSPADELTSGGYSEIARKCLAEIVGRQSMPILVGGTGFYLRSVLQGLSPAPARNPELRNRLNGLVSRRPAALHRLLGLLHPDAAARIHPNDHQKLIRAVELARAPALPRQGLSGFRVVKIGLNPARPDLYERINQRVLRMFEGGLLDETRGLLASGVEPGSKALQNLGYKQAVAVLEDRLSLPAAIAEVQTRTRQDAKRQMTWFRGEPDMQWISCFGDSPGAQESGRALVAGFVG